MLFEGLVQAVVAQFFAFGRFHVGKKIRQALREIRPVAPATGWGGSHV